MYKLQWLRDLRQRFHSEREVESHVTVEIATHLGYGKAHIAQGYKKPGARWEADVVLFAGEERRPEEALVVIEVKKPGNTEDPLEQARFYATVLGAPLYATCAPGADGLEWAVYETATHVERFRCALDQLEMRWEALERLMHRAMLLQCYPKRCPPSAKWEADAAEWAGVYRERVDKRLGQVQLFGRQQIDLGAVYVPVRLAAVVLQRAASERDGRDDKQQRDERQDRLSGVERYPEEWLRQQKRLVVIGDPGAGKTTLLRHLGLQLAASNIAGLEEMVPLYVPLNRLFKERKDIKMGLFDFFWEWLRIEAEALGIKARGDLWFQKLLEHGRAALLWDGLDEVTGYPDQLAASTGAAEEAFRLIRHLSECYPAAPVLVTCRRGAWQHRAGNLTGDFQVVEPVPFGEQEVERFLQNWFHEAPAQADAALRAIEQSQSLRPLSTNPLLLTFMAYRYQQYDSLPDDRYDLFDSCIRLFIREWDEDPERRVNRRPVLRTQPMRGLLRRLALQMHLTGTRSLRRRELRPVVEAYLQGLAMAPVDVDDVIEHDMQSRYGLIREFAPAETGFIHLVLQEFLAAEEIKERWAEWPPERLLTLVGDPWWEEVLLHLAAAGRAEELIGLLLEQEDDLFLTNLRLAGRCLAVARGVSIDQTLRDAVVAALWARYDDFYARWQIAAVLAEIGGDAIAERLLRRVEEQQDHACLRALAQMGYRPAAAVALRRMAAGKYRYSSRDVALLVGPAELPVLLAAAEAEAEAEAKAMFVGLPLLNTLASLRSIELRPALLQALGGADRHPLVRLACLAALLQCAEPAALPHLRALWGQSDDGESGLWATILQRAETVAPAALAELLAATDWLSLPASSLRALVRSRAITAASSALVDPLAAAIEALPSGEAAVEWQRERRLALIRLLAALAPDRARPYLPPFEAADDDELELLVNFWPAEVSAAPERVPAQTLDLLFLDYDTASSSTYQARWREVVEGWWRVGRLPAAAQRVCLQWLVYTGCTDAGPAWLAQLPEQESDIIWRDFAAVGQLTDDASRCYLQRWLRQAWRPEHEHHADAILRAATARIGRDAAWATWLRSALPEMPWPQNDGRQRSWLNLLATLAQRLHLHITRAGDRVRIVERRRLTV